MKVYIAALLRRWLKFNVVGALGILVQMLAVYLFGSVWNRLQSTQRFPRQLWLLASH